MGTGLRSSEGRIACPPYDGDAYTWDTALDAAGGLVVSGTNTTAINVSAVQTDETGLDAAAVFQHGTLSTALAYGTQTDYMILKSTHITGAATGTYIFGNIQKVTTSADSTGYVYVAYNAISTGYDLVNGYATKSHIAVTDTCELGENASVLGTLEITANKVITGTGTPSPTTILTSGLFSTTINAGASVEQEVSCIEVKPLIKANIAGTSAGIRVNINCSSPNYVDYGIDIRSMGKDQTAAMRILATPASNALATGIYMEGQDSSTSTITNAIGLAGTVTNVLDFAEGDGSQGATEGTGSGTTNITCDAKIKIDIEGSTYYIVAYDGTVTLSS